MEQIVIQVSDKEKADMLLKLLNSLDFVDFVSPRVEENIKRTTTASGKNRLDFFSLAGLWKNRKIDLELIRKKAWPRQ
ncbi:MAG: hypothetical protein PF690_00010 [Deltaproteobacteria bacterium]|jgi:hypothetical protein|nr:hypothetical protein [Deltaproteobacteria bacterium]